MKLKRMFSFLLALLFILALAPVSALAEEVPVHDLDITVQTKPTKLVYVVGETLDLTGIELNYYDGINKDPTVLTDAAYCGAAVSLSAMPIGEFYTNPRGNYKFTASDASAGKKTIIITYKSDVVDPEDKALTLRPQATYVVTVLPADVGYPSAIAIKAGTPTVTDYYVGESIDLSGLVVEATMEHGGLTGTVDVVLSDLTISPSTDYVFTAGDAATGTKEFTLTYKKVYPANTLTFETILSVNVLPASTTADIAETKLEFAYADIGKTQNLTITVDSGCDYMCSSSDPAVATVDDAGVVTAVAPGKAVITLTARGSLLQDSCEVVVYDNELYPTAVELDKTSLTMSLNETAKLTAKAFPSTATKITYKFESDDPAVVAVDQDGNLTALKAGTTNVSCYVDTDGSGSWTSTASEATCAVTVVDIPVSSITISQTTATVYAGSSFDLNAVVLPSNASNPAVTWFSNNTAYATVDNQGKVTTIYNASLTYPVTVEITVTAGLRTAKCVVTLKKANLVTELRLDRASATVNIGESFALVPTILPSTATNKTLEWTSSDKTIATVDSAGVVTGVKIGNVTITAKTTDGSTVPAVTCLVGVTSVSVLNVKLDQTVINLTGGDSATIKASVTPTNATISAVKWTSSNTSIATVNTEGVVTAKDVTGYAIITATATDGSGRSAECAIVVTKRVPITGITINYGTSLDLLLNDTVQLKANLLPSTATSTSITWASLNTSVATVDATGKVSGLKLGTAVITAKVDGKSTMITITVTNIEYNYGVASGFKRRVNVRASASGLSKMIGYAYVGDAFKILGKSGNWYQIQYNKTTKGYIWANYLKVSKTSAGYTSAGAVGSGTTTGGTTTGGTTTGGTTGGTTTNPTKATITNCLYAVNVRSGASTSNTRIGKAKLGATYTYLATEGEWIKVQYNATTIGYIHASFCLLS